MYTPSLIKTNARYRGSTESDKFINMMQEIAHDLKLMCYKIDGNELNAENIGHREAVCGNMEYYIVGEGTKTMIEVPTAAKFSSEKAEKSMTFQRMSPIKSNSESIKSRVDKLDSEINFLLNNL